MRGRRREEVMRRKRRWKRWKNLRSLRDKRSQKRTMRKLSRRVKRTWRARTKAKKKRKTLTCAIYELPDSTAQTREHHRRRACRRPPTSFHSPARSLRENQNPAALPESAGGKPLAGPSRTALHAKLPSKLREVPRRRSVLLPLSIQGGARLLRFIGSIPAAAPEGAQRAVSRNPADPQARSSFSSVAWGNRLFGIPSAQYFGTSLSHRSVARGRFQNGFGHLDGLGSHQRRGWHSGERGERFAFQRRRFRSRGHA